MEARPVETADTSWTETLASCVGQSAGGQESPPDAPAGEGTPPSERYRCSFCGSEDVESMAWVRLNDESISSYDETPDYWCPDCNEHRRGDCEVTAAGLCTAHDQQFADCRARALAAEKGDSP